MKITAERMLILTVTVIIVMCSQFFDLTIVRKQTLETLHLENADLNAKIIALTSQNERLSASRESLIAYSSALLKDNDEKEEFLVSRGAGRISETMPADTQSETMLMIQKLELENRALQAFYKNTTGNEIEEIREVRIESTMFTNAEGAWPSDSPNYGMMASGKFTYPGAVAAPRNVPIGSTVIFTNELLAFDMHTRIFTVEDRGGRIVNGIDRVCIDIWTDDLEQAHQWGRNKETEGFIIIPKGK